MQFIFFLALQPPVKLLFSLSEFEPVCLITYPHHCIVSILIQVSGRLNQKLASQLVEVCKYMHSVVRTVWKLCYDVRAAQSEQTGLLGGGALK